MDDQVYQIVSFIENDLVLTVNYLCTSDPIQYSLFRCSFSLEENHYSIFEILQYCIKLEEFLDIRGLYSLDLEQSIAQKLCEQLNV